MLLNTCTALNFVCGKLSTIKCVILNHLKSYLHNRSLILAVDDLNVKCFPLDIKENAQERSHSVKQNLGVLNRRNGVKTITYNAEGMYRKQI